MQEKISRNEGPRLRRSTGKELDRAWGNFRRSLKTGKKAAREKAAGGFLLAFARLCQSQGLHSEMALRRANARFERDFRRSEKKQELP